MKVSPKFCRFTFRPRLGKSSGHSRNQPEKTDRELHSMSFDEVPIVIVMSAGDAICAKFYEHSEITKNGTLLFCKAVF